MAYSKINFRNSPDASTPLSAANLNHVETQYDQAVSELTPLINAKAPSSDISTLQAQITALQSTVDSIGSSKGFLGFGQPGIFRTVACTVRRVSATEWTAISDSGHEPVNVASVAIVSGDRVRITYSSPATKVISVAATPDEAFSAAGSGGVRVGASVALTHTDLFFYNGTSSTPVDPGTLTTSYANIWFIGIFKI